jgi:DNA uptake protein ComE-like DNA-binding protein
MSWRDFFYFSKGERTALILLLCLITVAGILLIVNNKKNSDSEMVKQPFKADTISIATADNKIVENKEYKKNSTDYKNKSSQKSYSANKKNENESVSERADRIITESRNASRPSYPPRSEKFSEGTVVELNAADTITLKKIPGIGSSFAKRIVKYRDLLGGYYSVTQLSEVYGIDEEKYYALSHWFTVDASLIKKLNVNELNFDELNKHPYIDYKQAKIISQLVRKKGKLTGWDDLRLLEEFSESDRIKLQSYLSFE